MGTTITRWLLICSIAGILASCASANGDTHPHSPTAPAATATISGPNLLSTGQVVSAGYPGALDGGTVMLAASLTHAGDMVATSADGGAIFSEVSSTSPSTRFTTLSVWYPKTNTTTIIAPALANLLPRMPLVAVNAQWSVVVYEPVSNAGQGGAGLIGSGWQLYVFNRQTGARHLLSQDGVGAALPTHWNTFITPEVSLSGDTLVWREYVLRHGALHGVVHVTQLTSFQTRDLIEVDSSTVTHLIFSPTVSGHYAAWCNQTDINTNPSQVDLDRSITVFDLDQGKVVRTIKLDVATRMGAGTPALAGDTLQFTVYARDNSGSGIAYTTVTGTAIEVVAGSNLPDGSKPSPSLLAWGIFGVRGAIAYNLTTHQSYEPQETPVGYLSAFASGNTLFWQSGTGIISYQAIG